MKTSKKKKSVPLVDLNTKLISKPGMLKIEIRGPDNSPFIIPVIVLGVRKCYGRVELRVKAMSGIGVAWVSESAVDLNVIPA